METNTVDTKGIASVMYCHFLEKDLAFWTAQKLEINTKRSENLTDPNITSFFIHSTISRFVIPLAITRDSPCYTEYWNATKKQQKEVRDEFRNIATLKFLELLALPLEVPQYKIEEATEILQKAGMLVFNTTDEMINLLEDLGYTIKSNIQ